MTGLTRKQVQVLDFIRAYTAEHRCSPTFTEIGAHLGVNSRSVVFEHVHNLAARGELTISRKRGRSIRLAADPLSLHLPPAIENVVRPLAERHGCTREEIVIEALRDHLLGHCSAHVKRERQPNSPSPESPLQTSEAQSPATAAQLAPAGRTQHQRPAEAFPSSEREP